MRRIEVTNKSALKLLNSKAEISKRQQNISEAMEELEKEFNANLSKYARIDEKVRPTLKKILEKYEMGEYEEVSRVHQDTNGEWFFEIADRLEEFKYSWDHRYDHQKDGDK